MQDQIPAYRPLAVQSLFKRTDRKITRYVAIRYTCNYAVVMQVENRAIISDIATHEKQIGEIGQPFLIDCFCRKILTEQQILKMCMLCTSLIFRRFSVHNRAQAEFLVHVLMSGNSRKIDAFAHQIDTHPAILCNPFMCVVDGLNLLLYVVFLRLLRCISLFSVIVIGIRINIETPKQPTNTEQLLYLSMNRYASSRFPLRRMPLLFLGKDFLCVHLRVLPADGGSFHKLQIIPGGRVLQGILPAFLAEFFAPFADACF